MSDPLREVLRSPLDDLPDPMVSTLEVVVLILALVVGIGTGWVGASTDAAPATSTTTMTTVPTEPLDLPPGWTDIETDHAVAVTWMYTRGPDLLVGVSIASRAGDEPTIPGVRALGPERRGIGLWTVELSGGEQVSHTREMFDPTAPGVVTIEFAGIGATVDDIRAIRVRPETGYGIRVQQVSVPTSAVPASFDAIEPIAVTERIESSADETLRTDLTFLTVEQFVVDWSNAALTWTLEDAPDIRTMVEPTVTIEGTTTEPVVLSAGVGNAAFLQRGPPPSSPSSRGTSVLQKIGGATARSYDPERITLSLTISWLRYGQDEIDIDLDGVTRLPPVE
jgi:hypothetical protein